MKNKIKCVYGEATMDRSNVYRSYKMFSEGREDVKDKERAGRQSTSTTDENIDVVKKIVLANWSNYFFLLITDLDAVFNGLC